MMPTKPLILALILLCHACVKKPPEPVKIGINLWPGYEFLYLAEKKGFFQEAGVNIKLVQMSSLSDSQRAYINGRIDGQASTIIEAVQSAQLSDRPPKIALITDYSNGGDLIVASADITAITDLRGRRVGCEVGALGIYLLNRALILAGMNIEDVEIVNVGQLEGESALLAGEIDAFVTYPPTSVSILQHRRFTTIFSSAQIPFEIVDTVSISAAVIDRRPELVRGLHTAWQKALTYSANNPDEAYQLMAEHEGIGVEEFKAVLSDLVILNAAQQRSLFNEPEKIQNAAREVCEVLVAVNSLTDSCESLPDIVYRGPL